MKFYKIRHIATGLFYKPSSHRGINLSKVGKVYGKKPSLKTYEGIPIILGYGEIGQTKRVGGWSSVEIEFKFYSFDFQLVEYETTEKVVSWI